MKKHWTQTPAGRAKMRDRQLARHQGEAPKDVTPDAIEVVPLGGPLDLTPNGDAPKNNTLSDILGALERRKTELESLIQELNAAQDELRRVIAMVEAAK